MIITFIWLALEIVAVVATVIAVFIKLIFGFFTWPFRLFFSSRQETADENTADTHQRLSRHPFFLS